MSSVQSRSTISSCVRTEYAEVALEERGDYSLEFLAEMKADPAESLYVGDVYSVDYIGARNSGW